MKHSTSEARNKLLPGGGLVGETTAGTFGLQPEIMVEGLAGEGIRADMVNPEGHLSDRQPHLKKHLFVERLHFGNNVYGEGVHVHGAGRAPAGVFQSTLVI